MQEYAPVLVCSIRMIFKKIVFVVLTNRGDNFLQLWFVHLVTGTLQQPTMTTQQQQ